MRPPPPPPPSAAVPFPPAPPWASKAPLPAKAASVMKMEPPDPPPADAPPPVVPPLVPLAWSTPSCTSVPATSSRTTPPPAPPVVGPSKLRMDVPPPPEPYSRGAVADPYVVPAGVLVVPWPASPPCPPPPRPPACPPRPLPALIVEHTLEPFGDWPVAPPAPPTQPWPSAWMTPPAAIVRLASSIAAIAPLGWSDWRISAPPEAIAKSTPVQSYGVPAGGTGEVDAAVTVTTPLVRPSLS